MYLKSLRLQGFKTFARRTELPFSHGITAIVGPNGSGKSNLVDAIRWALGERNARGLRGQRMEDVIYSGGPGKSAVGMAEVTLVIDNADQRLNVEFTEIEVARRLFRSGESEYLINGTRARLKDIDALLASTGLRQDGYAVTAQNDIDFVIQAAPALRRELIEEAAGVRRLRDQRQEALNRLAEADRDMRRARDILNELTPRAEELRVQAVAAEEYQKVADTLKALQGSLARDAWRKAMVHLRRALARVQAADNKRAAAAEAIAEFEPRYGEHRQALLVARESRWRHQETVAALRLRLAESQHQARIAQERNLAAVQALEALQAELKRLSASEQAGSRVVDELARGVEAAEAELSAADAALQSAREAEQIAGGRQATLQSERVAIQEQRQELQRRDAHPAWHNRGAVRVSNAEADTQADHDHANQQHQEPALHVESRPQQLEQREHQVITREATKLTTLTINAPRKAAPKSATCTPPPWTTLASQNMMAFTTSVNRPRVSKLSGSVSSRSIGRKKALRTPRITAKTRTVTSGCSELITIRFWNNWLARSTARAVASTRNTKRRIAGERTPQTSSLPPPWGTLVSVDRQYRPVLAGYPRARH